MTAAVNGGLHHSVFIIIKVLILLLWMRRLTLHRYPATPPTLNPTPETIYPKSPRTEAVSCVKDIVILDFAFDKISPTTLVP